MKQKAQISNVEFFGFSGKEYVRGVCVSHPGIGTRGLYVSSPIRTTQVVRKFKNGNFVTLNTHYFVVDPKCPK